MKTMKSNSKETNRIKEHSKLAIKFANIVLMLGILFSVLVAVFAVYKIYNKPEHLTSTLYYSFLLFSVLSVTLFVLGLRKLSDDLKVSISVLLITVLISVYGFETYLEFSYESAQSRKAIAEKMGIPYDTRTKMEVIEDLRDSGRNAYPNFYSMMILESNGLSASNGRILPLGGISNITTTLGNESGYFNVIETDEHGFNNPKGLYEINKVDIVLTGDSYTEGEAVHSDESIGAVLRESGFNTISVGKGGNGPLTKLAALKEYGEPLKPKIALWLFYQNDLVDLIGEMESPLLQKYLNELDFSQNLISRQEEIDSLLVGYVEDKWEKEREMGRKSVKVSNNIKRIILIKNLRNMINLLQPTLTPTPANIPIFKDILQKSKQMVSGWGGKMYFVYLPSFDSYSKSLNNNRSSIEDVNREFVLGTVSELEIPIIDIHKEVFNLHPDPLSLFPFKMVSHYNAEGYRLVAESISNRLKADGIIPLNLRN